MCYGVRAVATARLLGRGFDRRLVDGGLRFVDEIFSAVDDLHGDDLVVNLEIAQELLVLDDVTEDGVATVQNVRAGRREFGFAKEEEELGRAPSSAPLRDAPSQAYRTR